jgi:hypothetical protein
MIASGPTFWRIIFRVKGVWNCALSTGVFLFDDTSRRLLGVPLPDPVYRSMFLALAFVFGLGYWWVGRDLDRNHDIIRMGIFGQISVFAISLHAVTLAQPRLPWPYLLPGLVDLAFALAFLIFLWTYPKSAWGARRGA